MSEPTSKKPQQVPDGHADYYITRQLKPTEKGFIGFETIWKPWHKEVPYTTPKKP